MGNQNNLHCVLQKQLRAGTLLPPLRCFEIGLICKFLSPSEKLTKCARLNRAWYNFSKTQYSWTDLPSFQSEFFAPCHYMTHHLSTLQGFNIKDYPGVLLTENDYQFLKSAQSITISNLSSLYQLKLLIHKPKLLSILTGLEINLWNTSPQLRYPSTFSPPSYNTKYLQPLLYPLEQSPFKALKSLSLILRREQALIIKEAGSVDFSIFTGLRKLIFICEGQEFSSKTGAKIKKFPLNLKYLHLQLTGHYHYEPATLSMLSELNEIILYHSSPFRTLYQKSIFHLSKHVAILKCTFVLQKWLQNFPFLSKLGLAEQKHPLMLESVAGLESFELIACCASIILYQLPRLKKIILQRREVLIFQDGIGRSPITISCHLQFKVQNLQKYPTFKYSLLIGKEPRIHEVATHQRYFRQSYLFPKIFTDGLNFKIQCLGDFKRAKNYLEQQKSVTLGVDFLLCSKTSKFNVNLSNVESLHIQGALEWLPLSINCPKLRQVELFLPDAEVILSITNKLNLIKVLCSSLRLTRPCNQIQVAILQINTIQLSGKLPFQSIKELTLIGTKYLLNEKKMKCDSLYFLKAIHSSSEVIEEITKRAPKLIQITLSGLMKQGVKILSRRLKFADISFLSKPHGVLKVANEEVKKKLILID